MEKLTGPMDMNVGGVYNIVYAGPNEAYAKINGKRTILVLATEPKFEYVRLYYTFGSIQTDDLRGNVVTVIDTSLCFKEDEIYEPADESEWFKHAVKVASLADGVEQGVLTREIIKSHPVRSNRNFVSVSDRDYRFSGLYTSFDVEGKTSQPCLQRVYIWWNTWEEMFIDFEQYDVNARRS